MISKVFLVETPSDFGGFRPSGVLAFSIALCLSSIQLWGQTSASVSVNAGVTAAAVPPEGYGVDTAVYDNYLTTTGVASQLKAAGVNAIRYPGGSYADIFNFISGTNQTLNGGYFASGDAFNNFMSQVVLPEGGKAVITVNYGSNTTASGPALPSEAAAWVQYANVINNYGIVYWEIGNEIYGNGYYGSNLHWEEDLHVVSNVETDRQGNAALSPTAYGTNAAAFIKAMKAVDPNIKCGIFVNTASYYTNWDQDVLTGVSNGLKGSGYTLDFVIVHWYPGGSNAQILAAQSQIPAMVSQIRSDIKNYYTLGNGNSIEIAITETGAGSVGGIVPALFASDEFMTWMENGATNVEYQELHNGFLDNGNNALGPWYGTSFASTVARPGDNFVSVTSSNALLRAHAVHRADGKVAVVLINEDPNNSTTVNVSVSNATLSTTGTEYSLGNANFPGGSSTSSTGVQETGISGVGNTFTVTVPAYTEYAILIPTGGVSQAPVINSLSPTSGAAGLSVTINGSNFGSSQGSSTVNFGGTQASVTLWSATSIAVKVPSLSAGAVNVTVSVGGSSSNSESFTVTGTTPPGFTLSASASALSVAQGHNGTDTISVHDVGGFTGSVTLVVSGLPSGVTAAVGTNPTTGSSVITLTASATAATGTSTVTVKGTSGTLTASTTVTLTITPGSTGGFACHVGYTISNQWQGGFGAALTIGNTGSTAISNWTLTWTFADGQTVTQLWNGTVAQSGANVTVTNASYDGSIPAGGSVTSVGFNGTWNNSTNSVPVSFAVNGTTCH
jgi:hypothetical protein